MADVLTPEQLRDLIAEVIAGVAKEGSKASWRAKVGPVEKLPIASNVRSNWSIKPTGAAEEKRMILLAAETIRKEHPYVAK